ncbi:MAG: beta-carotene ketolase [Ignavibacteriaceae bacterium]|nr:MAG: fatty acid desaturase [Chlorobiota bacterium]GJQ33352.1 MAG: beta-carotene ketolase [Ignavibacteriaceae bacterium]
MSYKGLFIALAIIGLWGGHLFYILSYVDPDPLTVIFWVHLFVQGYLYTGLFITGHDAMHGTVSKNKTVNKVLGFVATILFAGMSYNRLIKHHFDHHRYPGSEKDPDFNVKTQNFWLWWFTFMRRYTTIGQIVFMAVAYNVLKIWFSEQAIILFWVVPAFLGTLQLFYFGTYLPHKYPHTEEMLPHNARSLKKNHVWAMVSCYFFGYHYEHHSYPGIPWWRLYRIREKGLSRAEILKHQH